MDPLSISASVVALATLAAQVGCAFIKLRENCLELPGRINALSNEVADLEIVLHQLRTVLDERQQLNDHDQYEIAKLISQARERMQEMLRVLDQLNDVCARRTTVLRASLWRKVHPKLQSLQEEIRTIKNSLNILLGASNSRDMLRVRIELEALSAVTTQSSEDESAFRDRFADSLASHEASMAGSVGHAFNQVDHRVSRIEDMLQGQLSQLEANHSRQLGILYGLGRIHSRRRSSSPSSNLSVQSIRANSPSIAVRVRSYVGTGCRPNCPCACHIHDHRSTSSFLDRVVGRLFIGYAGLPYISSNCDTGLCERRQALTVSAEYWFPLGFCWSQIIKVQLGYEPNLGPHMSLCTLRQVPDTAPCIAFALEGNVEGLKTLFSRGLASPKDVSSTRGYSLLRWALYGQKYDTCRFLLQAGADPCHRPISISDDCPSDKANDIILRGSISPRVIDILRAMAEGSEFIENQNFSLIHRVVLGLSSEDLETAILQDPEDIDVPDAMGRSALEWAAARGDDRSVATLLSYGADPNVIDKKLNTPLTLAANQNHTVCVRLLLESGADPDPMLPSNIRFGTPLNCAARNASDPLLLKTLLDFNANVEATGIDGVTPLLHVARNQGARHAIILLDYGADINAVAKDGRTPLTTAIMFNNHDVLALLLDRWYEYSACPRLQGPHLLDLVVRYADARTMRILSGASHLKLRCDDGYVVERFAKEVRQRPGVNEEVVGAFEVLLEVLKPSEAPEERGGMLNRVGTGLGRLLRRGTGHSVDGIFEDEDEEFVDAQEEFDPALNELCNLLDRGSGSMRRGKTW